MKSRLLINLGVVLSFFCSSVYANESDDIIANFSGFAYYTWIQDNDFHENEKRAAINADISRGNFALRGQITTQEQQPRRLVLEYAFPVNEKCHSVTQIGRFVRLDGFYNNVTDSPSSSGMSFLPLSTYNRRMNTGTFTIIDGINTSIVRNTHNSLVETGVRLGKVFIEDTDDIQREASGTVIPDINMSSSNTSNYDFYVRYNVDNQKYFFTYNHYQTDVYSSNLLNPLSVFASTKFNDINYTTYKIGALNKYNNFELSSEFHVGDVKIYDNTGNESFSKNARNIYVKGAYDVNDELVVYSIVSYGESGNDSKARNFTLGTTWDNSSWAFNLEWHKGYNSGSAWTKYDAPEDKRDWSTLAASIVKRF